MSNSKLISCTILSPNCNKPRNHAIDRITPHHMACNLTVEQCGNGFANPARQASSNYGIGTDGRIGLYVDEANRSWCSSSPENDHRAITIEVANDKPSDAGGWHVSDKALASLITLCVDICKRNGKKKLLWLGSKEKALSYAPKADEMVLTLHKWFAATGCPGPYLEGKMPYIAAEVTKRLSPAPATNFRVKATHGCYTYDSNKSGNPGVNGPYKKGSQWTIERTISYAGTTWGKVKGADKWVRMDDVVKV